MKPKYPLMKNMLLASLFGAVAFVGCKKDNTVDETTAVTTTDDSTTVSARAGNRSPVIKTGADQSYTTAVSSITLDGSRSYDPDGYIRTFLWTKDFGPGGTITSPNSGKTNVTGLTAGVYRFRLKITDNRGASTIDTIRITNGSGATAPGNQAPVVNAGANQSITSSSTTLSGSASDDDGTIASYQWTKVSGSGGTITSPNSATTTVTGLTTGSYVFNLKATDNDGASGNKTVTITVGGGTTPPNQAPVVNAGSNQTTTSTSVTLNGSATDADGTIASYLWTKVSGSGGTITSPNSATTTVTGLSAGSYVFNLRATDNKGATGNKTVTVTVNSTTTPPPTGSYGTLMYSTGYNSLSEITNSSNQLGQGGFSSSVKTEGAGSFRSMVNSNPASNISSGWRSEVQYSSNYSRDNDEIVVEYDMMYEKLFTQNGLTTQWHGNASGTSGQLGLWVSGGKFMVMRSVQAGQNIYQSGTLMPIQTNKWYKMRWEIKFTSGSNGYVRLYIDNQLYYSVTGKTCDGTGQYLKIGTNRWNVTTESVVYFDALKIWKR